MLDDPQDSSRAVSGGACNGCTEHVLKVKNDGEEAQEIHVGAHVWQDRGYGWFNTAERNCAGAIYANPHHTVFETGVGSYSSGMFDAGTGVKWIPKFTLGAGQEKEFTVQLNWNREGVKKDWSFVAWGTKYDVTVTHKDGLETDVMPLYDREFGSDHQEPTEIVVPSPPPPPPATCHHTDNGAVDPYGDGCIAYESNP